MTLNKTYQFVKYADLPLREVYGRQYSQDA